LYRRKPKIRRTWNERGKYESCRLPKPHPVRKQGWENKTGLPGEAPAKGKKRRKIVTKKTEVDVPYVGGSHGGYGSREVSRRFASK